MVLQGAAQALFNAGVDACGAAVQAPALHVALLHAYRHNTGLTMQPHCRPTSAALWVAIASQCKQASEHLMQLQSHPLLASTLVRLTQLMSRCRESNCHLCANARSVDESDAALRMGGADARAVLRAVAVQHAASCGDDRADAH